MKTDDSEEPASSSDTGLWIAVIFVGGVLLLSLLFAVYLLAWNGGANT